MKMKSLNEKEIIVSEKTMEHMAAHQGVNMDLVAEAVAKIKYEGPFLITEVDLGRVIGTTNCVRIRPGDEVEYLYRKNRAGKTPFVKGRDGEDTTKIVIGICDDQDNDGIPTLFTAFYGVLAPREPWDARSEEEKAECEAFWSTHALTWDEDAIDPIQDREALS